MNLIISRWREDISWIYELKDLYNIIVYQKINTLDEFKEFKDKDNLSFRGCEATAYFQYILKEYDNLSDYTVFLFGTAQQKVSHGNLIERLKQFRSNPTGDYIPFGYLVFDEATGFPHSINGDSFLSLSGSLPIGEFYELLFQKKYKNIFSDEIINEAIKNSVTEREHYESMLFLLKQKYGENYRDFIFPFHTAGNFILSRKNIHRYTKDFYQRCLTLSISFDTFDNEIDMPLNNKQRYSAFLIERLWKVMYEC